jgi:hypothetical protein
MSNAGMNSLRLSGSARDETCSPDTTVPWITRMSRPASRTSGAYCSTRAGVSDAHETTPPSLISTIRLPISSGLIGSAYNSCIRRVAFSSGRLAISS